jgi:hypothetical protein
LVEHGVLKAAVGMELVSLNADVRTIQLLDADPEMIDANLRAAIKIDVQVAACTEQGVDFWWKLFSLSKYLDDMHRALSLGYQIGFIYVALSTPEADARGPLSGLPCANGWAAMTCQRGEL